MAQVSKHGEFRVRKRLGLPKKTVEKMAVKALEEGLPAKNFKGSFRRYLDRKAMDYHTTPIVYKNNIYIFNMNNKRLITVWQIPNKYRKLAEKNKV